MFGGIFFVTFTHRIYRVEYWLQGLVNLPLI
jgi:hypothetical protein